MAAAEPEILFCDNCLVVVNKPPGLLSQGDRSGDATAADAAAAFLRRTEGKERPFIAPVHRLDRPVSGALILARKSKVASRLGKAFRDGAVGKLYWAVVEGRPPAREDTLTGWLQKDRKRNTSRLVEAGRRGAAPAELRYELVKTAGARSLLAVHPKTGRPHQIRVQLSAMGCPIVGDLRYGSAARLGRLIALHCRTLAFQHPVRLEPLRIEAAPPAEWADLFPMP